MRNTYDQMARDLEDGTRRINAAFDRLIEGRWICLLCKSGDPRRHGALNDGTTLCPEGARPVEYFHGGNETTPTTAKRLPSAPRNSFGINDLGGVADGTRTHDDQNHNLGRESSVDAGCSPDEGNSCD